MAVWAGSLSDRGPGVSVDRRDRGLDRRGLLHDPTTPLIAVPASIATSARRLMLHLSINWPWQQAWTAWRNRVCGPPVASEVRKPPHASTVEHRRLSNQDQP
jgi:hypothetical protein